MQKDKLLKLLKTTGAIMEGHFLLTSGLHSNLYIEKFRILENPIALNKVCKNMADIVNEKKIDLVLGAAIGGILISGGVGRHLKLNHIFSERVNGKMELRRGFEIHKDQNILIVEDIITTGGSVVELIELVKKNRSNIIHILSLVDRSKDGINFEFPFSSLINIPSQSWKEEECPLCQKGITISKRGRSGKA